MCVGVCVCVCGCGACVSVSVCVGVCGVCGVCVRLCVAAKHMVGERIEPSAAASSAGYRVQWLLPSAPQGANAD